MLNPTNDGNGRASRKVPPNPDWVRIGTFAGRHPTPTVDHWLFRDPAFRDYGPKAIQVVHTRIQTLWDASVRYVDFFPTGLNVVGVEAAAEMVRHGMVVRVWYFDQTRRQWFTRDAQGLTFWRTNAPLPDPEVISG